MRLPPRADAAGNARAMPTGATIRDPSKKKGGSPDGLPPFVWHQNSSLSFPGTVSMTRSSMALGSAP